MVHAISNCMDYYSILGVPKTATEKEIRKAYKTQSMKHHPDRGGDEEQFKKINEAYSTLKDPQKRAAYDRPEPQINFNSQNMGGFEDIFANMFGGARYTGARASRNPDITIRVNIDLSEVLIGKKLLATYKLRNGQDQTVDLDIPAGCTDGDKIRFQGLGENFIPGKRGDLFVVIGIRPKAGWDRRGDDLYTTVDVNSLELIIGTKVIVTTLSGKQLELRIPQGTKNGTTFSMPELGLPNVRGGRTGNLFVKINAVTPQNLNNDQLSKIKEVINGLKTN